jgi:hypothetical protein
MNTIVPIPFVVFVLLVITSLSRADTLTLRSGEKLDVDVKLIQTDNIIAYRNNNKLSIPISEIKQLLVAESTLSIAGKENIRASLVFDSGSWEATTRFGKLDLVDSDLEEIHFSDKSNILPLRSGSLASVSLRGRGGEANSEPEPVPSLKPSGAADKSPQGSPNSSLDALTLVRSDAVTLGKNKFAIDISGEYVRSGQRPLADQGFAGRLGLRVGVGDGIEAFAYTGVQSWKTTLSLTQESLYQGSGLTDSKFGFNYRINRQMEIWPETVFNFSLISPTGIDPYFSPDQYRSIVEQSNQTDVGNVFGNVIDPRNPLKPRTGGGAWGYSSGFTFVNTADPIVLFGGIDYTHFRSIDYSYTTIEPGDVFGIRAGFGMAVTEKSSFSQQVIFGHQNSLRVGGQSVAGSSSSPISMRFAYTHRMPSGFIIEPSLQFGVTADSSASSFTVNIYKQFN